MADSSSDERQRILGRCRAQRRDMLRRWDDATEAIIAQYESETLATREQRRLEASRERHRLAEQSKPFDEEAEAKRLDVLRIYDQEKSTPGKRRQADEQAVGQAHQAAIAQWQPLADWLRRRGVAIDASGEDPKAVTRLGHRLPDSIRQAIEALEKLAAQANQLRQQTQTGLSAMLIDHYLLPAFGLAGGLLLGGVAWFTPAQPSVGLAVGVLVASAIAGVVGHMAWLIPLRKTAKAHAGTVQDLRTAIEHCAQKAMKISASVHRLEADDLIKTRDHKLAQIDTWLATQRQTLQDSERASMQKSAALFEQLLKEMDQQFETKLAECETTMRQQADQLAADINRQLGAAG